MPRVACLVLPSVLASALAAACAPARGPSAVPEPEPKPELAEPSLRTAGLEPASFRDPNRRAKLEAAFPAMAQDILAQVEADEIPGLAVGVVIDGELAWAEGFGTTTLGGEVPVDAATAFRIGSITKVFTATRILQLRDAGALDLDAPARTYLPELAGLIYPYADGRALSLADLLTHSSGLPRLGEISHWYVEGVDTSAPGQAELLASLDGFALVDAPGIRYQYSNLGFALLGAVIGRVEGPPRASIHAGLLGPLGMDATVFDPSQVAPQRLASAHDIEEPGAPLTVVPTWSMGPHDLAGGLYSNVEDMARFVAWNLDAWPERDEAEDPEATILTRASRREAQTIHFAHGGDEDGPRGVGWGWQIRSECGIGRVVGHSGATDGFRAELSMLPEHGVGLIVLHNSHRASTSKITSKLLARLRESGGLAARVPPLAPALTELAGPFAALLEAWDDEVYDGLASAILREQAPGEELREELGWWHGQLGACTLDPEGRALASNRARYRLHCEAGDASLELYVHGGDRPRVLGYELSTQALALPEPVAEAAADVLALARQWNDHGFEETFAARWDKGGIQSFLARIHGIHGACSLGLVVVEGPLRARINLECETEPARMTLAVGPGDQGRVEALRIVGRRPRTCD